MKTQKKIILLILIFIIPLSLIAQENKSQHYKVWDVVVKPGMFTDYEDALKKQIELSKKYNFPFSWSTYVSHDFHYYIFAEIENHGNIDEISTAFSKIAQEAGDEWQRMAEGAYPAVEYMKRGVVTLRPNLSYIPEKPKLQPEEAKFISWGFCYVKTGKSSEFETIQKEWVKLFKENNIPTGFNMFSGGVGTEQPFYFWAMSGKSEANFWVQNENNFQNLGEGADKLWNKTLPILRKFEPKTGMNRPDLSYIIEK